MAPKKKPKSALQAAAVQKKKGRSLVGGKSKRGAKHGAHIDNEEDPNADDVDSVETGSVESDDAEHMTLDELYDAWAAGQLHGDIVGALNSAPPDPSTGLVWWQWVERKRGVATHVPPLGEPRFSAAPTLDELYDSWADGTLAANRLEALNSAPPDPATGLSWWQWVERSRGIELHDPLLDEPLFVRRENENEPPVVDLGAVDFGEHSLQASLQGLYDEWTHGRLSDETLASLRNAPSASGLLWWQFIERARGIEKHDPPQAVPYFQRFPPVEPPESLRALALSMPPADDAPPPLPPPTEQGEKQGGGGSIRLPPIPGEPQEDEEEPQLWVFLTPADVQGQRSAEAPVPGPTAVGDGTPAPACATGVTEAATPPPPHAPRGSSGDDNVVNQLGGGFGCWVPFCAVEEDVEDHRALARAWDELEETKGAAALWRTSHADRGVEAEVFAPTPDTAMSAQTECGPPQGTEVVLAEGAPGFDARRRVRLPIWRCFYRRRARPRKTATAETTKDSDGRGVASARGQ